MTSPWSANASSVLSGIVLIVNGAASALDVEGVGGVGILGAGAREEQPLGPGALVGEALPALGVEQLAIRAIGVAWRRRFRAGYEAPSGTSSATATSQRLTKIEATEGTLGSSPASIRRSTPRMYASAAPR